ncbi:MAG TPA: PAS domain S-box protein [Gemmatimonadales bacterium]|nr:PAS domain S-box protein [Gemmatimonadales bacterium]
MNEPGKASEQRLRAAIDSAPSGLLMIDAEGRIVLVNREVERLFGYPREELLGRPVELIVPERFHGAHPEYRGKFTERPSVRQMGVGRELFGRRKDGTEVPVEIGLTPLVTDEGLFVLSSIVDITARRKAEARFRAAVESSPSGMVMVDSSGKIILVNREVERLFGYSREELLGRSVDTLVPERFRRSHPGNRAGFYHSPDARAMGAGRELFGLRKDGTEVPVEIGLNPIETEEGLFVLSSIVDISSRVIARQERAKLEEQLRQSQKMEAVGTLAGGVAHDFNNILGGILGYAELALAGTDDPAVRNDLGEVIGAAVRGRELVSAILRFSRRQETVRKPVDLAQVVAESLRLLRPTLPSTIAVEQSLGEAPLRVLADATAVQQVVMNLATNAAHAMPSTGRLEISLEPFYARDSFVRAHPEMREGQYVMLRVRDTGSGMTPEVRVRAMEPFFTTKPPGSGSGLGLAMVHGIMREHEGLVELDSIVGEGTTVRCLFPAIEAAPQAVAEEEDDLPRGHGERVLFLDDEPSLSRLGARRLEALGYEVTALTSPEQALQRLADQEFDLVVTDYTMPKVTGLDLAKRLRGDGRKLPIILLSGVASGLDPDTIAEAGVSLLIAKPVGIAELATAIRQLLDGPAEADRKA